VAKNFSHITIPNNWEPWKHQIKVWDWIVNQKKKRAACIWHRRAGKDIEAINIIAACMVTIPGTYWHVLPTYAQGRKAIWQGMTNEGRKFIDHIPPEIVENRRKDDMLIKIYDELGGSQYQIIGGDNPDRIVGGNPIGVVFSEYAIMNPLGWDLVRPILNANGGWALFIYTPRGHNHGYKLLKNAKENPTDWFTETLTIHDTVKPNGQPIMTDEMVQEEIRMGMPEELAAQEYYCDFEAPLVGAYYGKALEEAANDGRIGDIAYQAGRPVYTSWDIGVRDSTAIWFFQIVDGWVNWIDYYAASGEGVGFYIRYLQQRPYVYSKHYGPHDVAHREFGTGQTIAKTAADLGFRFTIVPKLPVADGIEASRLAITRSRFDAVKCAEGIECLLHYRKEFDLKNRVWGAKPIHDWSSHGADAFRTAAVVLPSTVRSIPKAPRWRANEQVTWNDALKDHDIVSELTAGIGGIKRL
jgi:hypothetical protein